MQKPINIQDGTGAELLEQLDGAFETLATENMGGTEPQYKYPGMSWIDTSGKNAVLRKRNAKNTGWVEIGTFAEDCFLIKDPTLVNTSLSNLTEDGEKHFLNKSQITNTILEAPNGIAEYSGSVINVKGDIKVLFSDGRNSDKTLKSIEYKTGAGLTFNVSGLSDALFYLLLKSDGSLGCINTQFYYEQQNEPEALSTNTQYWLDTKNNLCCFSDIGSTQWDIQDIKFLKIALFNVASSVVTSFDELSPVELLKRGDKSEISSFSAPSGKPIEYTLLASGKSYTAPLTGWWYLNQTSGVSTGSYATIYGSGLGYAGFASNSGNSVIVTAYVAKGTQVVINHTATGAIKFFGFIPAKGEVIDG